MPAAGVVRSKYTGIPVNLCTETMAEAPVATNGTVPALTFALEGVVDDDAKIVRLVRTYLEREGFTVVEASDTVSEGTVISTSPEAGVNLAEGEIVTVFESTGKPLSAVPSVNLLALAKAKATLTDAGFTVGDVTKGFSATAKEGDVIGSDPEQGTKLAAGSVVNIVVSNGKIKIPDVVGMTVGKATTLLQGQSLQLDVTVVPDNSCSGQKIGSQSLKGEAPQQSKITIVYCAAN